MTLPEPNDRLTGEDTWVLHLYRGISQDAAMWRQRLDVTANWAVPLVIALLTLSLSDRNIPHFVLLLLGWVLISLAVLVEARRYRTLHHTLWRVRNIEVGYFAPLLESSEREDSEWRVRLAADLRRPAPSIDLGTAIGVRLRNTYLVLVYLLFVGWLVKLAIHPALAEGPGVVLRRMAVEDVPWWLVGSVAVVATAAVTLAAILSPPSVEMEQTRPGRSPRSSAKRVLDATEPSSR